MKASDSPRHEVRSVLEDRSAERSPYWLAPFHDYKTMCPYLVGSYDRVARELARYIALGCGTFILDVPYSQEELQHTSVSFERAIGAVEA